MNIEKICIWIIVIVTSIIGIFDFTYDYIMILIPISFVILLFYNIVAKKRTKISIIYLSLVFFLIIGTIFRENSQTIYAILYIICISSYLIIADTGIEEKTFKSIANYFAIISIPTMYFNGFLNKSLISGHAFAGRLMPAFYIIYIIIAFIKEKNMYKRFFLFLIAILNIIALFWTKSRASIISIIILLLLYIIMLGKLHSNNLKITKILKIIFVVIVTFQLLFPIGYVVLYENMYDKLNEISVNITGKRFFTGRQDLWLDLRYDIEENWLWGTGDLFYEGKANSAHNELLEKIYFWGIIPCLLLVLYLYSLVKKAIKEIKTKDELFILLSYFAIIMISTFETFLYKMHYIIFSALLLGYLIKNKSEGVNSNESLDKKCT